MLDGARGRREVVVETAFEAPAVLYSWGAHREQLFDLEADPGELRNLAAESALDPLLEQLRGRLRAWCLRTEDTRFLKRLFLPPDTPAEVHDEIFAVPY